MLRPIAKSTQDARNGNNLEIIISKHKISLIHQADGTKGSQSKLILQ